MHITLSLNEDKLKLSIESDFKVSNPGWVVNWADSYMSSIYAGESGSFTRIDGGFFVTGDKIKDFLIELVKEGKDSDILTTSVSHNSESLSLPIQSIKQALHIHSIIQNLSLANRFTKEQFNCLIAAPIVDSSESLDAKTQFVKEYNRLYQKSMGLFSRDSSKMSHRDLNEIVKDAKDNDSTCRAVCVQLGWMKANGSLNATAPQEVSDAYNHIPDLSAPQAG